MVTIPSSEDTCPKDHNVEAGWVRISEQKMCRMYVFIGKWAELLKTFKSKHKKNPDISIGVAHTI